MQKKQRRKKSSELTEVRRVRLDQDKKINKIGEGNFRAGVDRLIGLYDLINKDPTTALLAESEHLSNMIKVFASENHYKHYVESGMPVVLRKFVKTGYIDVDFLKRIRKEKSIDEFKEDDKDASG